MLQHIKPLFRWRWRVIAWWHGVKARLRVPAARLWRPLLFRTTFIAVCGSAGKTTTKELLGAILERHFSIARTSGTWGGMRHGGVPGTLLSVRPWHRFAIIEAGIESRGQMAQMGALIRPDIVLMLAVKECHIMEFKTLEAVAAEKSEMLKQLGSTGVAILNGDDARVDAMAHSGDFRVVRFGRSGHDIEVRDAHSRWPQRLQLTLAEGGRTTAVRSRLVGTHWISTILAAVTTARQCGLSMEDIVPAIEQFEPFWARMQPLTLANGVTFLRDEWNGSYDTFIEALKVLNDAAARRKIAVISDYSDSHNSSKPRQKVRRIARQTAPCVDLMICVGERAEHGRQAAIEAGLSEECAFEAYDTKEASEILQRIQQAGDLVLLKGRTSHHLSRIYLAQLGTVACNLQTCPRQYLCDRCGELGFGWEPKYDGLMAPPEVIV